LPTKNIAFLARPFFRGFRRPDNMAHLYDWIVTGSRAMLRRSRNSARFVGTRCERIVGND
jgi:hypothetical protein